MNSLEFIEKEIDVTKKQLTKYPLSKEQSDPNYKHKEADIQYIHNKYYTERLQTLQQIKSELEAWEIAKNKSVDLYDIKTSQDTEEFNCDLYKDYQLNEEEFNKLKNALEVEECVK